MTIVIQPVRDAAIVLGSLTALAILAIAGRPFRGAR